MAEVTVWEKRTTKLMVSLGYDVSQDVITSQIREGRTPESELIAEWNVAFLTDGTDGELVLTIDDSLVQDVSVSNGYMDGVRVSNSEPLPLFDEIIDVVFKEPGPTAI